MTLPRVDSATLVSASAGRLPLVSQWVNSRDPSAPTLVGLPLTSGHPVSAGPQHVQMLTAQGYSVTHPSVGVASFQPVSLEMDPLPIITRPAALAGTKIAQVLLRASFVTSPSVTAAMSAPVWSWMDPRQT